VLAERKVYTGLLPRAETIVAAVAPSPTEGFEANVRGTWTVLQACLEEGVSRVVLASSDKGYGAHQELSLPRGLRVASDRPVRGFKGSRRPMNLSRLVPGAISAAIDGPPPVLRSDGSPDRDFLYIDDAVSAFLAIARLARA
jgi:CDP-glucose 4,6-dehydratase